MDATTASAIEESASTYPASASASASTATSTSTSTSTGVPPEASTPTTMTTTMSMSTAPSPPSPSLTAPHTPQPQPQPQAEQPQHPAQQATPVAVHPAVPVRKRTLADYNLGRVLGEGSYSTVMAAVDLSNRRDYAIKVLDKRHIIREKKVKYVNIEKNVLYKLDHPGVVKLYSTFQDSSSLYYVLELCQNGELLTFIKKLGSFDENCTRFYVAQILTAVEYVHSQGVIHRDLKPENILLDSRMYVKLTDFGTAKMLEPSEDGTESDRANSFVGTAEYVSPELLTEKAACKSSDLWALGCIIYQLLAGRPPFKGSNEYQTFQKIVKLEYSFPAGFPRTAMDLVSRLLVHNPNERLGANNTIDQLKQHPFFDGVEWSELWKQPAPKLLPYLPPTPTHNTEPLRSDHDACLWSMNRAGESLAVVDPFRELGDTNSSVDNSGRNSVSKDDEDDDDDSIKDGLGRDESYIKSAGALGRSTGPSISAGRPSISSPPSNLPTAPSKSVSELANANTGTGASHPPMDATKSVVVPLVTPMAKSTSTSAIELPPSKSANGHTKNKSSSRNAFVALFSHSSSSKKILGNKKSKQVLAQQQEAQDRQKSRQGGQVESLVGHSDGASPRRSGIARESSSVSLAVTASEISAYSRKARLELQAEHSPWHSFLLSTELVIHQTPVLKRKGFFSKSIILVLTDLPRLLYFDDSSHYFAQLFNSNTNDAFGAWQQKQNLQFIEHQLEMEHHQVQSMGRHMGSLQLDANGLHIQHNPHPRRNTGGLDGLNGGNGLLSRNGSGGHKAQQRASIDQPRLSGHGFVPSATGRLVEEENEDGASQQRHSHHSHSHPHPHNTSGAASGHHHSKVDVERRTSVVQDGHPVGPVSSSLLSKAGSGNASSVSESQSNVTLAPTVGASTHPSSPSSFPAIKASKKSPLLKGEIGITSSLVSELKGKKCFFIHTTRKSYYFEESNQEGDSKTWVKVLQRSMEEWFGEKGSQAKPTQQQQQQ
ncbi:pkb-activating kinase-like protein [Podila minutissima]|nr:pkb-activating kinase-like protein [Podila minutissima]